MATEQERLKGIIEIDTVLRELDQLLVKLTEVESAIQAVDGSTVRVNMETRGFESAMAQMGALRGTGVGDVNVGGAGGVGPRLGRSDIDIPDLNVGQLSRGISQATRNIGSFGRGASAAAEATGDMAKGVSDIFDSLDEFDLRMTDIHNALARLVPLILVIIGALPALIAGLVGLAAAAAAATAALLGIAGFGALGFAMAQEGNIMEGFSEILSQVREDFLDAFTPLAQQLAPLFEDALDGLDMFFQALADNGDALLAFEQTARAFGSFIVDEFPDFIAFLADVARAFEPVFSAIADALFDNNLGQGFMTFMADVIPALMMFGALVADLLPHLLQMSIGFLRVTNAIIFVVDLFFDLLNVLGISEEVFGAMIAAVLTAASAMLLLNSTIVTNLLGSLASLGTRVLALISTYTSYSASSVIATLATYGLAKAVLTLIGFATLGIGAMATLAATTAAVGDRFSRLTGGVNDASSAIRNFDRTTSRMDGARVGAYGPSSTIARGQNRGQSVSQTIRVEGDADKQTLEQEQRNGHFRMKNLSTN